MKAQASTAEAREIRRPGKTRRDKASGAWMARFANRVARDAYCSWCKSTESAKASPEIAWANFRAVKAHGLGNGAKRFKLRSGRRVKGG